MGGLTVIHWAVIGVVVSWLIVMPLLGYILIHSQNQTHIQLWQRIYVRLIQRIENQDYNEFPCTAHQIKAIESICKHGLIVDGLMCVSTLNKNKNNLIMEIEFDGEIYLCILNKNIKRITLFTPNQCKSVLSEKLMGVLEYQRLLVQNKSVKPTWSIS